MTHSSTYAESKHNPVYNHSVTKPVTHRWFANRRQTLSSLKTIPLIQPKLKIGAPDEINEQEADRVADQVMRMPEPTVSGRNDITNDITTPTIHRLCQGCQEELEDQEELEEKNIIHTKASTGYIPALPPNITSGIQALKGGGQPLSKSSRSYFEPRFGYDFSRVRIHADSRAADLANSINARAFTLGNNVVFGAGQYSPETPSAQHLMAHELTHVIQNKNGSPENNSVLRRVGIGEWFARLFGGGTFSQQELFDYINFIDREGRIEGHFSSDNKVRAIVSSWKQGSGPFSQGRYALNARRKALMIKEMQDGFTGDDDERAILELLERSDNSELSAIFGSHGVTAASLNSDFHTDEWQWLQAFYYRRFEGGMSSVLAGRIVPRGNPVPFGQPLPRGDVMRQTQPISQTGGVACPNPQARQQQGVGTPFTSCCTDSMIREILSLRQQAAPIVQNAARKLATDPNAVSDSLQRHFRVSPTDLTRIRLIVGRFEIMLNDLTSNAGIRFLCNFWGDTLCREHVGPIRVRQTHAITYPQKNPPLIRFCGNYSSSTEGGEYLSDSNWLKTMIHEYAHIGSMGGPAQSQPFGEEQEFYYRSSSGGYPAGANLIRNADSYAHFAMEVR